MCATVDFDILMNKIDCPFFAVTVRGVSDISDPPDLRSMVVRIPRSRRLIRSGLVHPVPRRPPETRKPSAHTMKAYRQDFTAIA